MSKHYTELRQNQKDRIRQGTIIRMMDKVGTLLKKKPNYTSTILIWEHEDSIHCSVVSENETVDLIKLMFQDMWLECDEIEGNGGSWYY